MTIWEVLLLVAAGIIGGLAGSIAGLASVSTYPALLLVGLSPVAANVTNTVALVFNGIGSVSGSLPELRGQRVELTRLIPTAVVGGAAGAALLLSIPAEGFENVVPVLLAVSAVVIALPSRKRAVGTGRGTAHRLLEAAAVLAICVYGGFFGAAAGVLMLALFLSMGSRVDGSRQRDQERRARGGERRCGACLHRVRAGRLAGRGATGRRVSDRLTARARDRQARPVDAASVGDRRAPGIALAVKLGLDTYR